MWIRFSPALAGARRAFGPHRPLLAPAQEDAPVGGGLTLAMPDPTAVRQLDRVVAFASLFSIALGLLGLIGAVYGITVLTSVLAGHAPVTAATALGHVLSGASLWLLRARAGVLPGPARMRAGRALAFFVVLLAALRLWGPGSALMPSLTAVYFVLIGLALLSLDWPLAFGAHRHSPAEPLALAANTVALVVVFDLLGAGMTYTHIALHTAAAAFVTTFAVACARTDWGVGALMASAGAGGSMTRRLWPANVFVPLLIGAVLWNAYSADAVSDWGAMTVLIVSMAMLLALLTVWSGQRIDRRDLERRRAGEELLRVNRALRALSLCNEGLIHATDETAWLHRLCHLIVDEAGYRLCWVGQANEDEGKTVSVVAQAGFDEGYLQRINVTWADSERGRGPTGTCIRTGRTHIVPNTATDPYFEPWRRDAIRRGFGSVVGIPLTVGGRRFGALTIYAAETNAFGRDEVRLLNELASDLAFGMEGLRTRVEKEHAEAQLRRLNAELEERVRVRTADLEAAHSREAQIGFRIQQMLLLTQPPTDIPGLDIGALTLPSERIDGDFYDFLRHDAQHVDVIVADVMGKGVSAALVAAATKSNVLEALCHLLVLSDGDTLPLPKEIVTLAHADMVRQLIALDSFVTMSYARVDLRRRVLELVDCGHTGMIVVRGQTGACEVVHGDNLPLGIREGELFDQIAVPFAAGDLFLFYSDGITEMRNPAGEQFGVDRLTACVHANRALEPQALVKAIRDAVIAFAVSERLGDDLTCVAIRIGEAHRPLSRATAEISSDLRDLRVARGFARDVCRRAGCRLDTRAAIDLELAINEAASNVMKHAYHGRTDQRIQLEADVFADRVSIRLHHLGDAFDPAVVAPPALDGSRESGFGIYLINHCVDEVRYSRDERGRNCIELVKILWS